MATTKKAARRAGKNGQKPARRRAGRLHAVEMLLPKGGIGRKLKAMHLFHADLGIKARADRRHDDGRHYVRWCFAEPQHAASFWAVFGGELVKPPGMY